MTIDLDVLEGLLTSATKGPWVSQGRYIGTPNHMSYVGEVRDQNGNWTDTAKSRSDAALIVAAVNALPELIAAARERDAMREALAEAVGRFVESLSAEPAIAERVEAGQQFNAYDLTDGDGAKALCIGSITSRPVSLCEAPASVADLLECALRVAMKARQALNQEQPA